MDADPTTVPGINVIPESRWKEGIPPVMGAHLMDSGAVSAPPVAAVHRDMLPCDLQYARHHPTACAASLACLPILWLIRSFGYSLCASCSSR